MAAVAAFLGLAQSAAGSSSSTAVDARLAGGAVVPTATLTATMYTFHIALHTRRRQRMAKTKKKRTRRRQYSVMKEMNNTKLISTLYNSISFVQGSYEKAWYSRTTLASRCIPLSYFYLLSVYLFLLYIFLCFYIVFGSSSTPHILLTFSF